MGTPTSLKDVTGGEQLSIWIGRAGRNEVGDAEEPGRQSSGTSGGRQALPWPLVLGVQAQ